MFSFSGIQKPTQAHEFRNRKVLGAAQGGHFMNHILTFIFAFLSIVLWSGHDAFAMAPVKKAPVASEPKPQSPKPSTPPTPPPQAPDSSDEKPEGVDWTHYDHLDPQRLVPDAMLEKAVAYFDANKSRIKNQNYITVIDFSKHSGLKRFFVIDMKTGAVSAHKTAHGKNSDPDHDGRATKFSNTNGSNMSSLGFYLTGETYQGGHGYSLMLDGVSATNSNARSRAIVIHPADYVSEGSSKQGRSFGCPALDPRYSAGIINKIKNKSLIYAAYGDREI